MGAFTNMLGAPTALNTLLCSLAHPTIPCVCVRTPPLPSTPWGMAQLQQAMLAASFLLFFLNLWQHVDGSPVDSGLQKTSLRGSSGNFPHQHIRNKTFGERMSGSL